MINQKRNISLAVLGMASFGLAVWFAVMPSRTVSAATEGSIAGVVTDDAGKPIRGAAITAKIDTISISRYSDASGKYQLTGLKPGNYNISAAAYGFDPKSVDKEIGARTR